jgi:hypothetical protein
MDPVASMDAMEERKISYPCRESNLGRPAHSLVIKPTDLAHVYSYPEFNGLIGEVVSDVAGCPYSLLTPATDTADSNFCFALRFIFLFMV